MNTARSERLAETVVRVILMMGEYLHPPVDKARRNRLCADVHEPPLVKQIMIEVDPTRINGVKYILRPRNKKPDYRAFLLRDRSENPFGFNSPEDNRLSARKQTAEPVHFCARVVERRNTEENVVLRLTVVLLLGQAGAVKSLVTMKYSLGKSRCAR